MAENQSWCVYGDLAIFRGIFELILTICTIKTGNIIKIYLNFRDNNDSYNGKENLYK